MKNITLHSDEGSIMIRDSFEESGYCANAEQTVIYNEAAVENQEDTDDGYRVREDNHIYTGKSLGLLYNVLLPIFNVITAFFFL